MSKVSKNSGNLNGSGNTIRSRTWCLTLNNPSKEEENKFTQFNCVKWVYQIEEGEEKTKHVQGWFKWKWQKSLKNLKKLCERGHWEKAKAGEKTNVEYCTKEEGRLRGPYYFGFAKPIKTLTALYTWQQDVVNRIDLEQKEGNDRTINWYWDGAGNKGKTALAKYLCLNYNAIYIGGKANDCKYAVYNWVKDNPNKADNLIIIFGFPRTIENYVSYRAIEEIKDGIFFNNKYESSMCIMNSPVIICLANFKPEEENLSPDRWNVVELI